MKKIVSLFVLVAHSISVNAQGSGLKFYLPGDSTLWIRATGAVQVWSRYTEHNPGSVLNFGSSTNYPQQKTFDIGIRRARFQLFGQITKRTFIYAQFGINNFSSISARKAGAFFHDLVAEYKVAGNYLSTGGGLTGWSGLSRYAAPSIASTLMYDAPLFQQTTNDVNDQFLRKLSLYAKGKLGKFDYRISVAKPMPIQRATGIDTTLGAVAYRAGFSPQPPELQYQGYFMWQFLDTEQNTTPYTTGTYLGNKKVLTLGAGFIYQPQAMRFLDASAAVVHTPMRLLAADVFFDHPLDSVKRNAITAYLGVFNFDFGPNHVRTLGVMNPANASTNQNINRYSGFGNAFAMFGTGNALQFQTGYKFKDKLLGDAGTLQPYGDVMVAMYEALKQPAVIWNAGINWLINGHNSKVSLNYQDRPVFREDPTDLMGAVIPGMRRGMVVLQYLVYF